jgi:prepilin-type N-terminal cleavage/methylation domain-containing protein
MERLTGALRSMEKKRQSVRPLGQDGFSLIEVLIATTIFAVFIAMYVTSEGYNLTDSIQMREELVLKNLCTQKINEIISNPPELRDSLTVSKETKTFEEFPNYSYTLEWKKMEVPDMSALYEEGGEGQQNQFAQMIAKVVKDNMEKMIWQLKVTVKNKETEFFYTLSGWVYNTKADVTLGGF